MKKLLVITIASISLMAMQANATVTVTLDALDVLDASSALAPQGTVGLMLVDKSGDGVSNGPLLPGFSLALGQTFGGADNVIVNNITIAGTSGTDGWLAWSGSWVLPSGLSGASRIAIVWLPDQAANQATAVPGAYGWYQDVSWVIPADGGDVSYGMLTVSQAGSVPDSAGIAGNSIVIPEPSSVALVGLGLLGLVGFIRRRR